MPAGWFTTFTNCSYCLNGEVVEDHLVISEETGTILKRTGYIGGEIVDLEGCIIAPGFLELQTNGVNGFHFTNFENEEQYAQKLGETARYYATQGVTGFWVTIPTVSAEDYQKILPHLTPRTFEHGASLLGAHVEGPYLSPSKHGAHNPSLFALPSVPPSEIYGASNLPNIKLATIAPELPESTSLLWNHLSHKIRVSLGHSSASYATGLSALRCGATCLTHTLNAMSPFYSRDPGLAGLISLPSPSPSPSPPTSTVHPPFFSLIPDGQHLHPATVSLFYNTAPTRCILITDSVELAGLPDGTYPPNAQIHHWQRKCGDRATLIKSLPSSSAHTQLSTEPPRDPPGSSPQRLSSNETLVGSTISLSTGMRNLQAWTGCTLSQAVRTVTETPAKMMGIDAEDGGRGVLLEGRRADFVVLRDDGTVLQTWIAGQMVWEAEGGLLG
ncbi:carbohydrate esterase family 9 protein [Patellaria atrata CBS 101060]|uniref:N-acetylglucosamine-6-phosphate deacetylase n=1 Tax=Patellaria atrata CBS 101060 TaxID=1346257 RepID=A0A9P4SD20_9PEZI|nr:carbohydrate esterase family 9 protein [Patellaria atrata CBS 101060]